MGGINPDMELDCRGMSCPLPILKTKIAINKLSSGQILKMVATDPGSVNDMAAFSRQTGNQLIDSQHGNGEYVYFLLKS